MTADPLALLDEVDRATERVADTAAGLSEAELRAASPLPDWSRGHVLTHIARNADGLVNLLTWARTGVETPQYVSWEQRNADIESGSGRSAAELAEDLRTSAARFADAARGMPAEAWSATISSRGVERVAATLVWVRLREVEVHHVDVGARYRPADWPTWFSHRLLHELATDFSGRTDVPPMRLHATDLEHEFTVGDSSDPVASTLVTGTAADLASWLSGRTDGTGLSAGSSAALPDLPAWR